MAASRKNPSRAATDGGNRRTLLLVGGIAAIVLLVAGAALLGRGPAAEPAINLEGIPQAGTLLGDPAAPLLITEFTDYGCSVCKAAAEELLPPLVEEFVRSGQVRIEVVPVDVVHGAPSTYAAMAALCAADQNQFWAYQERLYQRQGVQSFEPGMLSGLTDGLEIDKGDFQNCLASNRYQRQVEANDQSFRATGAPGTPTFIVGDTPFSGNPPYDQVKALIESKLADGQ